MKTLTMTISLIGPGPLEIHWLLNSNLSLADRTNGRAYATVLRPSSYVTTVDFNVDSKAEYTT